MLLTGTRGIGLLLVPAAIRVAARGVLVEAPVRHRGGLGGARKILIVVGLAVGVFTLLCANEIFGMPPLMTRGFPSAAGHGGDLGGKFDHHGPPVFTINPDATVSGSIGDASLVSARIVYTEPGLGDSCIWRTDLPDPGQVVARLPVYRRRSC